MVITGNVYHSGGITSAAVGTGHPTPRNIRSTHMADPNAIVNDALKRRLVSITVLYTLAAAYDALG